MRRTLLGLACAAVVLLPWPAAAQGFGVAARVGTLGIGAELAIAATNSLVLRGGISRLPLDVDATIEDIDLTISLPETWYNVGADLYLSGALRIGAGILFKPDDFVMTAEFTEDQELGMQVFTPAEIGTLTGRLAAGDKAPYALIGFGKHTSSGIGLSLDIGAAFFKEPRVTLDSNGSAAEGIIQPELDREAEDFEDTIPTYMKLWPILNLAIRFGVG